MLEDNKMSKAIDSGMSNIADYLKITSSTSNNISTFKDKIESFDDIENLLINIRQDYKDFDFNNWLNCNSLKGKTEREIFISLSEQYDRNMIENKKCLNSMAELSSLTKNTLSNHSYPTDSLHDFFSEVKQSIIVGKHDYLDILKSIFSKYMDYVRDLREAMTSLSHNTKAGKKNGHISINFIKFYYILNEVKRKYTSINGEKSFFNINLLYQHKNDGSYLREIDKQEINYKNSRQVKQAIYSIGKLLKEIKGINIVEKEGYEVKIESNIQPSILNNKDIITEFNCYLDFSELDHFLQNFNTYLSSSGILSENDLDREREKLIEKNNIRKKEINDQLNSSVEFESIDPLINVDAEIDRIKEENNNKMKGSLIFHDKLQTEFDLFKKSLDALEKKINTNLDELSKKYSSANSNYDNFVKIVSSTMNTLLEMAKGFLRF